MSRRHTVLAIIVIAAWISGCAATTDEVPTGEQAALQEALELDNGGFTIDDADPMFGMEDDFADTGLNIEDPAIEDPMAIHGPDGIPYEGDEARGITVLILWGQLRINPELERPRRWDGEIATNIHRWIDRSSSRSFRGADRCPAPTARSQDRPLHVGHHASQRRPDRDHGAASRGRPRTGRAA